MRTVKVVLAEKPSVAREIASFLGASTKRDGYFENRDYQVTWALGHLVGLKAPDDYDPALKKWSLDPLPFVPERFELKLIGDKGAGKQYGIVKRLFQNADQLICATDAGREGELIFRYIQTLTGCSRKPCQRLWLSSLTRDAIRDAFRNLKPGQQYDHLYHAARCRSEADWIVGMNATRCLTVRHGQRGLLWSAGRVQTPVLAMIVRRDDEIRVFQPQPFWELMTRYRDTTFKHTGDRFTEQAAADELLKQVTGQPLVIQAVKTKRERSLPPQLFDLTELQRDMNRRYGMSAADTLKCAQSLYEQKLITYPRTDSRYLTNDLKSSVSKTLEKLKSVKPAEIAKLNLSQLNFTSRIVNNKKVSDHHAIIPTGNASGSLSGPMQKVFDAIVTRLIAAFYPPCEKDVTTVNAESNRVPFRARGVRVVEPGWTELYPKPTAQNKHSDDDETTDDQQLPTFRSGETGPHEPFVKQGETKPPKHFTENTLLAAMETAGKLVDDEELREAMKERGLGTPATRAATIETLLQRSYIDRNRKQLTATDLGRFLIATIADPNLKSPELTGDWEARMKRIEAGQLDARSFMDGIVGYAQGIISSSDRPPLDESRFGECPRCGKPIIEGNRGYGCSGWKDGCGFVLWMTYREVTLTLDQVRELLQHGIVSKPLTLPDGGDAFLYLTDDGSTVDVAVPTSRDQGRQSKSKFSSRKRRADTRAKSAGDKSPRRSSRKRGSSKSTSQAASDPAGSDAGNDMESAPATQGESLGSCPLCQSPVYETERAYGCSAWRSGCKMTIWKTIAGKKISAAMAKALLSKGKTRVLKGFKSKAGRSFDAALKLEDGKVKFDFDKPS